MQPLAQPQRRHTLSRSAELSAYRSEWLFPALNDGCCARTQRLLRAQDGHLTVFVGCPMFHAERTLTSYRFIGSDRIRELLVMRYYDTFLL